MAIGRRRIGVIALVAIVLSSIANIGGFLQAYATSDNDIISQALIHDLQVCYTNGKFNSSITVDLSSFNGLTNEWVFAPRLPNGFSNKDTIKCGDIVQRLYGSNPRTTDDLVKMLDAFGYEPASNNEPSQKCVSFKFNRYGSGERTEVRTQQICAEVDANGNVVGDKFTIGADGTDNMNTFYFLPDEGCYGCLSMSRNDGQGMRSIASISTFQNKPWSELEAALTNEINRQFDTQNGLTYNPLGADVEDKKNAITYVLKDDPFWQSTYASRFRKFSNPEIVYTYQRYLQMYANMVCTSDPSDIAVLTGTTQNGGYRQVKIAGKSGYNENCFVKLKDGAPLSFHGFTSDGYWNTDVSFDDILNTLGAITLTSEDLAELASTIDNSDNEPGNLDDKPETNQNGEVVSSASDQDYCMSLGGAMGWGLCPALYGVKGILEGIYNGVIVPLLQIRSSFVERGSGTYQGWSIFREIANIVFVIALLFIIFSQVTGIGIDNYGIKKTLPKLIVTAVLINFSFIICQLAVDVSNIVGSGLQSWLGGLGDGSVSVDLINDEGVNTGRSVVVSGGTAVFATAMNALFTFIEVAAVVGLGFAIFVSPGIIVSILIALLGALVAVLFMFISLGVRMAGVIILTIISPLAFIAYALPNTQSLFKKWKDTFVALLILYPICGLLIGGGQLASILMIKSINDPSNPPGAALTFFYIIIALLLSVVPFFALPALLKKSISALGGAGAAIGNLSSRLRGATRNIRNTEAYKRGQLRMNAANPNSFRAKAVGKLANSRIPGAGLASRSMARTMARNTAAYNKAEAENVSAAAQLAEIASPATNNELWEQWEATAKSGDVNAFNVATQRLLNRDGNNAKSMASKMENWNVAGGEGADGYRASLEALNDLAKSNTGFANKIQDKAPHISSMINNKGKDDMGNYQNARSFMNSVGDSLNMGDWSKVSTATLISGAETGKLTREMAKGILRSNDPAIQSGINSESDKRRILQAIAAPPSVAGGNFRDSKTIEEKIKAYNDDVIRERQEAEIYLRNQQKEIYKEAINESNLVNNNQNGNSNPTTFEGGAGI